MTSVQPSHEASLIYVIGRVNQGIRRQMRGRLSECNLSVQEYTTLSVLDARPGLSNAQLARRALVTPQSMIEILAKLQRRGLVTRAVDPAHARILRAQLSEEGLALLRAADARVRIIENEMLAGVPMEQRAETIAAMRQAMRNLSGRG